MKLQIDIPHRYACMRAHTATHLLHAELGKIFPQTKQAGSYVGPDELRFDFFAQRSLTNEEIISLNRIINNILYQNQPVSVVDMSYEDAIKTGAKAFFEDTYPEVVRVVSVNVSSGRDMTKELVQQQNSGILNGLDCSLQPEGQIISIELCGGTHVAETSQIGSFFITEQTAVAAGVKRITALTGPKVAAHSQVLQENLDQLAQKVNVPVKQLDAKIEKVMTELLDGSKKIKNMIKGTVESLENKPGKLNNIDIGSIFSYEKDGLNDNILFFEIVEILRSSSKYTSWLLYSQDGQYAFFHPKAKIITKDLGFKGGGSETFVQGRDENIIKLLNN